MGKGGLAWLGYLGVDWIGLDWIHSGIRRDPGGGGGGVWVGLRADTIRYDKIAHEENVMSCRQEATCESMIDGGLGGVLDFCLCSFLHLFSKRKNHGTFLPFLPSFLFSFIHPSSYLDVLIATLTSFRAQARTSRPCQSSSGPPACAQRPPPSPCGSRRPGGIR